MKRGKPFQNGDKRINRKGRPKDGKRLSKYVQAFLLEQIDADGFIRLDSILMQMANSKFPADRKELLERAYGKVREEIELSGNQNKPIAIKAFDYATAVATIAARPGGDSDPSGAGESRGDGEALG